MKKNHLQRRAVQLQRASRAACVAATVCAAWAGSAYGQADDAMVFVANNGNLEGSVTSLMIAPDGTLSFVDRLITGLNDDPGTNASTISLTPNGQYLCTGHPASNDPTQQLTFIEVASDGTLTEVGEFTTPSSPLSVRWVSNEHVAVTRTDIGGSNQVFVYEFDPAGPTLTQIDSEATGSFNSALAVDPLQRYLYAQDSGGNSIRSFAVNMDGTLDFIQTVSTGATDPLGIGVSPDGNYIYGGGGISDGGDKVIGYSIDTNTGMLTIISGSPFISPGASPKQVAVSSDGKFALVAHGTDSTMRVFSIEAETGALTSTGESFDVGFQGSLGWIAVLDDLVFVTDRDTILDGQRGIYSFTLGGDGSLTQNGSIVDTQGIGPNEVVAWPGAAACPADLTDGSDGMPDGVVDVFDLLALLSGWGGDGAGSDLAKPNDVINVFDLLEMLGQWGPCE